MWLGGESGRELPGGSVPLGWACIASGGRVVGGLAPQAWTCQLGSGRVAGSVAPGCEAGSGKTSECRVL